MKSHSIIIDGLSIPAIPISRSRRSRSLIPIDPDQCGAVSERAPLDAFPDLSVALFKYDASQST